jgi:hypothetical protein
MCERIKPAKRAAAFCIRHVIIIKIGPMAAARFAGFDDKSLSYRGSAALHSGFTLPPTIAG